MRHSCCEVRVMQLQWHTSTAHLCKSTLRFGRRKTIVHRTMCALPEAISAGGLTPATDTSLFLTTYRGGSHLPADIIIVANNTTIINDKSSNPTFWQILTDQESASFLDCLFSRDRICDKGTSPLLSLVISVLSPIKSLISGTKKSPSPEL